MIGLRLEIRK